MTGDLRHFPDVDEYVWLIETGDRLSPWSRWSSAPGDQPRGGRTPDDPQAAAEFEATGVARQALDAWLSATVAADRVDTEDLWLRCSAWRLGRVIDGGLAQTGPDEAPDLATYGIWLYAQGIDPDAVEVRTPIQVARAADDLRYHRTSATASHR